MSEPIGPGDYVECIDASVLRFAGYEWGGDAPNIGTIYTVERLVIAPTGEDAFILKELRRSAAAREKWGEDVGYGAFRFRPIYRPKADFIENLKTPIPSIKENA